MSRPSCSYKEQASLQLALAVAHIWKKGLNFVIIAQKRQFCPRKNIKFLKIEPKNDILQI